MSFNRKIAYLLEAGLLLFVALLFKIMPMNMASSVGGMLARMLGPLFKAHRTAERNLRNIFPEMTESQRTRVLSGMWDNLGRVAGEYSHLSPERMRKRMTIEGAEHLLRAQDRQVPTVFVSGHFANWELNPIIGELYKIPVVSIYREANNPYAEKIIRYLRKGYRERMYGKGKESARESLRSLQQKGSVAMLVDQKLNEGEPVSFFGHPVMTTTSAAKLAIKFRAPLVPLHVVRTDGAHFHVTIGPAIQPEPSDTPKLLMEKLHRILEQWIRQKPEQWFWVHNRWNWKK